MLEPINKKSKEWFFLEVQRESKPNTMYQQIPYHEVSFEEYLKKYQAITQARSKALAYCAAHNISESECPIKLTYEIEKFDGYIIATWRYHDAYTDVLLEHRYLSKETRSILKAHRSKKEKRQLDDTTAQLTADPTAIEAQGGLF